MITSKVMKLSQTGKSAFVRVEQVHGEIMVTKAGFVKLAKPNSKEVGDDLQLPWDKVQERHEIFTDEETGETKPITWLEEG